MYNGSVYMIMRLEISGRFRACNGALGYEKIPSSMEPQGIQWTQYKIIS